MFPLHLSSAAHPGRSDGDLSSVVTSGDELESLDADELEGALSSSSSGGSSSSLGPLDPRALRLLLAAGADLSDDGNGSSSASSYAGDLGYYVCGFR